MVNCLFVVFGFDFVGFCKVVWCSDFWLVVFK